MFAFLKTWYNNEDYSVGGKWKEYDCNVKGWLMNDEKI